MKDAIVLVGAVAFGALGICIYLITAIAKIDTKIDSLESRVSDIEDEA